MPERVAIVGSRTFRNLSLVRKYVLWLPADTTVVSGGATGVDTAAAQMAGYLRMPLMVLQADWKTHGKKAGFLRNKTIVENSDRVVAFWDGASRGTKHTIQLAREAGKPVKVFNESGEVLDGPEAP